MITASAGSTLALIPPAFLGTFPQNAVEKIGVFVVPAAIVVAIKSVRSLAKD
mgnify:FL=1